MQKGTVCGADRSVYKQNFLLDFCVVFHFKSLMSATGLAGIFV